MTATIAEAADALRHALTAIPGLRVSDHMVDNPSPPIAMVGIDQVTYHRAFAGGNPEHDFKITILVGRDPERISQDRLNAYLSYDGPGSVRAALETDPTLGGVVNACLCQSGGNIGLVSIGDANYLTVEFTVLVHP